MFICGKIKIKKIRQLWDTAVSSNVKGRGRTPDGTEDEAGLLPEALHHLKEWKPSAVCWSSQMLHVFASLSLSAARESTEAPGERPYLVTHQDVDPAGGLSVHVRDLLRSHAAEHGDLLGQAQQGQLLQVESLVDCREQAREAPEDERRSENHWIRARTVSAPGCGAGRVAVSLLTHIDGQTGLNIPEIYEQDG